MSRIHNIGVHILSTSIVDIRGFTFFFLNFKKNQTDIDRYWQKRLYSLKSAIRVTRSLVPSALYWPEFESWLCTLGWGGGGQ
jgi:hypothetical protein